MLLLGPDDVHGRLDYAGLIDALEAAHRGDEPLSGRLRLDAPEGRPGEGVLVLPAWAPGRAFGTKLVTVTPANPRRPGGLPAVQALYSLFDGATGTPVAVIDGTALTLRKTAADSALGARYLAPPRARTLLMIGAGALAPHLIEAHRTVRPGLDRVLVWNRTPARRDALVGRLRHDGVAAEPAADLEAALGAADVVSAATMATRPLVPGAWLRPGVHVDLVGGYTPEMREADDEAMARASVFVDFRGSTIGEVGDLVQPMAAGILDADAVRADLFALARGEHPGRRDAGEITLFKNGGGAHLDLFTAEHLMRRHAGPRTGS